MLLVLVLGVGASFAADSNQTHIQASDDTDTVISITETDTVSSNDNDTLISVSEDSGETLGATTGTFTDLDSLISSNYGKTLTLTQDYAYNSDYGKTTGIEISDAITIDGQGIYTLDGGGLSRIFQITGANVVIKNINFKNGYFSGTSPGGGAIQWSGQNGELTKCNFTKCTTKAGDANTGGGAVFWSGTRGTMSFCNFTYNSITSGSNPRGGAVHWSGTYAYIYKNYFAHNINIKGDGDSGAIQARGNEGIMDGNYFYNNTCIDLAGGTFIEVTGSYTVRNCVFDLCKSGTIDGITRVSSSGDDGGAMCINCQGSGTIIVDNCTFKNTVSLNYRGAALQLWPGSSTGKYLVSNCQFINNSNKYNGGIGGGLVSMSGYSIIQNCTFINNSATYGGGMYINVANNNVSDCIFEGNTANAGGGLYITQAGCIVSKTEFTDNNATVGNGGGIYVSGTSVTIDNCDFKENVANGTGGGFYLTPNNSAVIQGNSYSNNHANNGSDDYSAENVTILIVRLYVSPNGNGVGSESNPANWSYAYENIATNGEIIFVSGDYTNLGTLNVVKTVTITGQENAIIYGVSGSRIMVISAANAVVRNLTFRNAYFTNTGASIYWSGTSGTLEYCEFYDSKSNVANYNGGAVYWIGSDGHINRCHFENCVASGSSADGGAVSWASLNGIIENSYFKNNTCVDHGSAILIHNSANGAIIKNCTFDENKATSGHGTVSFWSGEGCQLIDSRFNNNIAANNGGAVYVNTASDTIINSNFTGNQAKNGGAIFWNGASGSLTESNFISNVATEKGGAIYWNTNDGTITSSNFNSNSAVEGSAIYLSTAVTEFEIKDTSFTSNVASGYGTVAAEQLTDLSIGGNTFTSNTVSSGATDYYFYDHTPENITSALVYVSPSGSASSLGMTSDSPTTFDHALEIIEECGKIVLLNGEYSNIVEKTISQSIAIVGSGNTVLLGGNKKFFTITANGVIIDNITFKNGKVTDNGGAITWSGANGQIIGSTFTNNVATGNGGALYWTGTGGKIDSTTFESNTAASGNNLYSTNTVTVTNSVLKDHFTLTKTGTISYGTDEVIEGTFASNAPSSITLYLGTTSYGSISVGSTTFSKTLSLIPVGTYAISFKDANSNTYTFTDNSFTVNRLSTVYISPSGTGSGNSASSPTTWDKVANIITSTGTVVFATGNYSNFYGKTINQGWTLQAASGATPVLDANNKGRIFTVSANNVKINGLTFKNGKATDSYGSAIHWTGTGGTLTNSVLTQNTGRPVTATTTLTITNNQLKDQITLTKSNINWAETETITGTFAHNAPSTVNILFNGTSQGSYSVASSKVTASYAFTNPSTRSVGSYVVTDLKNISKEVL